MFSVKGLSAEIAESNKKLITDIALEIKPNEIHLIMGPNGAGKSSLAKALVNWPEYNVSGNVSLNNDDISELTMEQRSLKGVLLAHQAPVEIPGVRMVDFLRIAYNLRQAESETLDPWSFLEVFESLADKLKLDAEFAKRGVNEGFSGGERKKSEVLQMLILEPQVAILDEIDSGVDIDAVRLIFEVINEFKTRKKASFVLVSHNSHILEYIKPDKVHLMKNGQIVETGDIKLAETVINQGYANS
ncbi:MAG: Fe-S cluster assembly ATPase SufC [Candidatus Dojkabacteria bacterium]